MSTLHAPILRWYDDHARDLPWRGPGASPWAVMVSEFMLQQTPVVRVLPVFGSWMSVWPTPGRASRFSRLEGTSPSYRSTIAVAAACRRSARRG